MACVPLISEMVSLDSSTSGLICARFNASGAGNPHAFLVETFAFADQSQRQMRQRSQIAARAHAALRRHHRSDAAVEHFAERVDDDGPHARVPLGERIRPQQHHGAGFRDGERFAHADRMRAHQVDLQFANLLAGDAHVAQFADAGGDGVGDLVAGDDLIDDRACLVDRFPRVRREQDGAAFGRDFADRFERQIVSVDVECVQWVPRGMFRTFSALRATIRESYFAIAARNAVRYFSGSAATFIFESVTMCVVSPSASNVRPSARTSS